MVSYCQRQSMDKKTIKFMFEGNSIKDEQTPEQLGAKTQSFSLKIQNSNAHAGMEDDDEIDAMLSQVP